MNQKSVYQSSNQALTQPFIINKVLKGRRDKN